MSIVFQDIRVEIPQQPPFKMIDGVVSHTPEITVCHFTPMLPNPMVSDGLFVVEGMIEMMAQTAAVRAGLMSDKAPGIGYIVLARGFACNGLAATGEMIRSQLVFRQQVMQFQVFEASVSKDGKVIATCEIRIFENE